MIIEKINTPLTEGFEPNSRSEVSNFEQSTSKWIKIVIKYTKNIIGNQKYEIENLIRTPTHTKLPNSESYIYRRIWEIRIEISFKTIVLWRTRKIPKETLILILTFMWTWIISVIFTGFGEHMKSRYNKFQRTLEKN